MSLSCGFFGWELLVPLPAGGVKIGLKKAEIGLDIASLSPGAK